MPACIEVAVPPGPLNPNPAEEMMMTDDFESDLKELSSAEDFLDYFGISYEPARRPG
jgi:hypothetical protein